MLQGCTRTYVSAERGLGVEVSMTPLVRSTRFGEYRRADHHHHLQRTSEKGKNDRQRRKWKFENYPETGDPAEEFKYRGRRKPTDGRSKSCCTRISLLYDQNHFVYVISSLQVDDDDVPLQAHQLPQNIGIMMMNKIMIITI